MASRGSVRNEDVAQHGEVPGVEGSETRTECRGSGGDDAVDQARTMRPTRVPAVKTTRPGDVLRDRNNAKSSEERIQVSSLGLAHTGE